MAEANFAKMTSMHFYAWKKGLKTGQYYLRTRPSRDAIKFTVNIEQLLEAADSGNSEQILQCLSLNQNNIKSLAAGKVVTEEGLGLTEEQRRDSRFISNNSIQDDDHAGAVKRPLRTLIPEKQEVQEEIVFECENCSG